MKTWNICLYAMPRWRSFHATGLYSATMRQTNHYCLFIGCIVIESIESGQHLNVIILMGLNGKLKINYWTRGLNLEIPPHRLLIIGCVVRWWRWWRRWWCVCLFLVLMRMHLYQLIWLVFFFFFFAHFNGTNDLIMRLVFVEFITVALLMYNHLSWF